MLEIMQLWFENRYLKWWNLPGVQLRGKALLSGKCVGTVFSFLDFKGVTVIHPQWHNVVKTWKNIHFQLGLLFQGAMKCIISPKVSWVQCKSLTCCTLALGSLAKRVWVCNFYFIVVNVVHISSNVWSCSPERKKKVSSQENQEMANKPANW